MEPFENIKLSFKCPKTINQMQPCNGGWNCDSCEKMVYDFRGMSETEILDVFIQKGQKLCGLYDAGSITVLPQKTKWHRWASAAMMALGITLFHDKVFAQSNTNAATVNKIDSTYLLGEPVAPFPLGKVIMTTTQPSFPDGDSGLKKYLHQHVKSKSFKGKVLVEFVVEKDGSLSNFKFIKNANDDLDKQIINSLLGSPNWIPAKQNGRPYRKLYTLPINFTEI